MSGGLGVRVIGINHVGPVSPNEDVPKALFPELFLSLSFIQ